MPRVLDRFIKIIALLLCYLFILCVFSSHFDPDLGWHLRFGQTLLEQKIFPYYDTVTWTNYGQLWVNHEWGGDIIWWLIYNRLGYFSLLALTATALFGAFLLAVKTTLPNITAAAGIVIFILLWSTQHILVARLTMLTPIFLVVLWNWLEGLPRRKNYWFLPALLWLWSAIHGSWILGFIVIAIYGAACLANLLFKKYLPRYYQDGLWGQTEIVRVLGWTLISAAVICLNPYGPKIWSEVAAYFTQSFHKGHISEWVASYTFPVYWKTIIVFGFALPLAWLAAQKKRLSWPRLLLLLAFLFSAWQYKRNALLCALLCAPLFAACVEETFARLRGSGFPRRYLENALAPRAFLAICLFLLTAGYLTRLNIVSDVWQDKKTLTENLMSVKAAEWLRQNAGPGRRAVFNEFNWGGYLSWTVPDLLLFLDGRGTVTWTINNRNALEEYYKIKYEAGGLSEIETGPSELIMLALDYKIIPKMDWVNRWLFDAKDRAKLFPVDNVSQLEKDLQQSDDWQLVFSDEISRVWEKKLSAR